MVTQIGSDGQNPGSQTVFSTSAVASVDGGVVTVTARVRAEDAATVVVNIETYGPNGRIDQQWFDNQVLGRGQTREFTVSFQLPAGYRPGEHAVKVGIFIPGRDWRGLLHWNDRAATFLVP